jgi:hypothetical protein
MEQAVQPIEKNLWGVISDKLAGVRKLIERPGKIRTYSMSILHQVG